MRDERKMNVTNAIQIHQLMTQQIQSKQQLGRTETNSTQLSFAGMLNNQLKKTNELQQKSDLEVQKFLVGETEDIHDMLIAMEEATISLEFVTQVRNKGIEAYQELKNMQI